MSSSDLMDKRERGMVQAEISGRSKPWKHDTF